MAFLGALLALPGRAVPFYGLDLDLAHPTNAVESVCFPLNERVVRLIQPDGRERTLFRDAEDPDTLMSADRAWVGECRERDILVRSNPETKVAGETGFLFQNGLLRRMLLNGREYAAPRAQKRDGVASLWPEAKTRLVADEAPDIWSHGERLRLWFDNPNKAGLLFVELLLSALFLFKFRRRWAGLAAGGLVAAFFLALVKTSSRGAILALVLGLCAIALGRLRALRSMLTRRNLLIAAAVLAVAVGAIFATGQQTRFSRDFFKDGTKETSRLSVWLKAPRMMADAPGGWGYGQSGRAYIDWYQDEATCLVKNLISGHLTFLVESSWPVRFGYVFLWLAALAGGVCVLRKDRSAVPLAVVVAVGAGACLNPTLGEWTLWIVPLPSFLLAFRGLAGAGRKAVTAWMAVCAGLSALICASLFAWGRATASTPLIHHAGGATRIGSAMPDVWVADDDYTLHGGYWWMECRAIRDFYRTHPKATPIALSRSVRDLPEKAGRLVLVGERAADYLKLAQKPVAQETLFLSPAVPWREIVDARPPKADYRIVAGVLAQRRSPWGEREKPDWVLLVPGAGTYIAGWERLLAAEMKGVK